MDSLKFAPFVNKTIVRKDKKPYKMLVLFFTVDLVETT
jgi:hypothetical protein